MGTESRSLSWLVLGLMELLSHLVSSLKDYMGSMATSGTLGWRRSLRKPLSLLPHHLLDGVMMKLGWPGSFKSLIGILRRKQGGVRGSSS
jgi:hypothetical protein